MDGLLHFIRRHRNCIASVFLFLITAAVFRGSLQNNFVAWDDDISIYQNPHVQGLDGPRLWWMFTDVGYAMRYKPLSWLCYGLIYSANGLNPFGFHLVGLLFHALNAALLYVVLQRLLTIGFAQSPAGAQPERISVAAALGALLWAVHPLRTEPAVWATDINYGQSLCFTLISLWYYVKSARPEAGEPISKWSYPLSVFWFALAMLTYPIVASYAAVLVVLDIYPLRLFNAGPAWWRDANAIRIWMKKIPFALLAGMMLLATILSRFNPNGLWAKRTQQPLSLLARAMQAFYVWAYYLWKPWAPFKLSPVYTTLVNFDPMSGVFVASAILVVGLTIILVWKWRAWPLALALWVCHLALLVPSLGLTEHPHFTSDRYSYVVGIFWPVLLSAGLLKFCRTRELFGGAVVAGLILAAALGVMSRRQTQIWRDTFTMYDHMIANLGNDPMRDHLVLREAQLYLNVRQFDAALNEARALAKAEPNWPAAHSLAGSALAEEGKFDDALPEFREALRLAPDFVEARNGIGSVLLKQGHVDEAINTFQESLKISPNNLAAQQGLDAALAAKKSSAKN